MAVPKKSTILSVDQPLVPNLVSNLVSNLVQTLVPKKSTILVGSTFGADILQSDTA